MPTRQARSIARIKAGLCRECGQPSEERYRCADCRTVRAAAQESRGD